MTERLFPPLAELAIFATLLPFLAGFACLFSRKKRRPFAAGYGRSRCSDCWFSRLPGDVFPGHFRKKQRYLKPFPSRNRNVPDRCRRSPRRIRRRL